MEAPPPQPFKRSTIPRLLRTRQWVKNAFVFFPAFFAQVLLAWDVFIPVLIGAILFSLAASAIYLFNDLRDVEQDRLHPVKCNRPIAAGEVPLALIPWASGALAIISLVGAYLLEPRFAVVLGAYLLMNLFYSLGLKRVAILDVTIVALGFIFRVHGGAILAQVPNSHWILLVTFLLALFIALAKRRNDLVQAGGGKGLRTSLNGYNLRFVDAAMVVLAALLVQSYIMYTMSEEVMVRLGSERLYITSGIVVVGVLRYFQLTLVEDRSGSPTQLVFNDRPTQLIILTWVLSFVLILYAL